MNKKKHITPKKEMDEASRKKVNIEKVGKIIFWFSDDSWYGKLLYEQVELTSPIVFFYCLACIMRVRKVNQHTVKKERFIFTPCITRNPFKWNLDFNNFLKLFCSYLTLLVFLLSFNFRFMSICCYFFLKLFHFKWL